MSPKINVLWFEGNPETDKTIIAACETAVTYSQEPYSEVDVDTNDFKKFVHENELDAWVIDYSDHSGAHIQHTGRMTWDEYCTQTPATICADLSKYLQYKAATPLANAKEISNEDFVNTFGATPAHLLQLINGKSALS